MGTSDHPDWAAIFAHQKRQAQLVTEYVIDYVTYPRIRYGDEAEDWGAAGSPCHDCGVVKGQFHAPGCDVEQCPKCGEQVISCDCGYATPPTAWRPGPLGES